MTRATFGVDIHAVSADHNKNAAIMRTGIKVKPYDISLRALIAKDVGRADDGGALHQRGLLFPTPATA